MLGAQDFAEAILQNPRQSWLSEVGGEGGYPEEDTFSRLGTTFVSSKKGRREIILQDSSYTA
jgi:hypothetical protein